MWHTSNNPVNNMKNRNWMLYVFCQWINQRRPYVQYATRAGTTAPRSASNNKSIWYSVVLWYLNISRHCLEMSTATVESYRPRAVIVIWCLRRCVCSTSVVNVFRGDDKQMSSWSICLRSLLKPSYCCRILI